MGADGMHYLEPTMMMMIEEALAVLGEGSAGSSIRADNTDDGHHPLKKMRKVEEVRKKNAGKQGEGDHKKKLKKKIKAMEKMKNARTRKDEATQTHDAEQEETRNYKHALDDRRRSDEALANETVDDN